MSAKGKAKILLVDDEPGMQRYIRTLLEVDDHKVETANTGEEALEKSRRADCSLISFCLICLCPALTACKRWSSCVSFSPVLRSSCSLASPTLEKWCRQSAWARRIT